ncbi:MAG: response regulator [Chloroflexi bacterium]|nr:MAG: response regulator [Chloroflexota bacterium]
MKQSILVIDDEPSTRYLLRILLESVGFSVQEANFGLDALNKINETQPDVMIFDVVQENGSGFAVCKPTDGQKTAVLPIVMLTAKTQWNVFTEIVRGMVTHYLPKPVVGKELVESIQDVINNALSADLNRSFAAGD